MPRKPLSKKLRFEVFKRDSFTCQYCGRSAPAVALQVDHISPVSRGGKNSILNLVTSCSDCNCGKGATELSDAAAVEKARAQAAMIQERREQIKMMAEWQDGLLRAENDAIDAVNARIESETGHYLTDIGRENFRRHIRSFGLPGVLDAIVISRRYLVPSSDENHRYTPESVTLAISRVGGICYNTKRRREHPATRYFCKSCHISTWVDDDDENPRCKWCGKRFS